MVKFFRFPSEHPVNFILHPWQLFFMILASWVHSEQQKIIDFYRAELEAVMKAQGKKRLLLTDDQRRAAKTLSAPARDALITLFTRGVDHETSMPRRKRTKALRTPILAPA